VPVGLDCNKPSGNFAPAGDPDSARSGIGSLPDKASRSDEAGFIDDS
jgi:hypothetical protein